MAGQHSGNGLAPGSRGRTILKSRVGLINDIWIKAPDTVTIGLLDSN